jgi:glutamyl-tRNA synthetase
LRIEDTDAERSSEDLIQGILDGLTWLGAVWDEGPHFQSRVTADHLAAAKQLLESGHAYKCFCTREAIEQKRADARARKETFLYDGTCRKLDPDAVSEKERAGIPFTIRLKVPEGADGVRFEDAVYGAIEKKYRDIEDFVIVRSNGQPLYILSNAVDDIRDGVTHVIRGQDGLANTPKQILLYNALGAPLPTFAHMSLALDPQKAKISKRKHGEPVAVHFYREKGFLPWALVNSLVLLGWSTPDNREIFSPEELIDAFTLEGVSRTNPVFDLRQNDPKFFTDPKAVNINAHYLRNWPVETLLPYVREQLEKSGLWRDEYGHASQAWLLQTIDLIRGRYQLTTDFVTLGRAYFSDDFPMDAAARKKHLQKHVGLEAWLPELGERISRMDSYTEESLEQVLREAAGEYDVKIGILVNGIRAAVTGQAVGPGFLECLLAIGQRRVAERLVGAIQYFS